MNKILKPQKCGDCTRFVHLLPTRKGPGICIPSRKKGPIANNSKPLETCDDEVGRSKLLKIYHSQERR